MHFEKKLLWLWLFFFGFSAKIVVKTAVYVFSGKWNFLSFDFTERILSSVKFSWILSDFLQWGCQNSFHVFCLTIRWKTSSFEFFVLWKTSDFRQKNSCCQSKVSAGCQNCLHSTFPQQHLRKKFLLKVFLYLKCFHILGRDISDSRWQWSSGFAKKALYVTREKLSFFESIFQFVISYWSLRGNTSDFCFWPSSSFFCNSLKIIQRCSQNCMPRVHINHLDRKIALKMFLLVLKVLGLWVGKISDEKTKPFSKFVKTAFYLSARTVEVFFFRLFLIFVNIIETWAIKNWKFFQTFHKVRQSKLICCIRRNILGKIVLVIVLISFENLRTLSNKSIKMSKLLSKCPEETFAVHFFKKKFDPFVHFL